MSAKLNLRDGGREEETKRGDQLVQYGDVLIFINPDATIICLQRQEGVRGRLISLVNVRVISTLMVKRGSSQL